jgi:alanine dehydrogenase
MKPIIGVPKEIKENENRVACTPGNVHALCKQGNRVLVETGAGIGSGFSDADYTAVGATIVSDADAVFAEADMILKVKEPLEAEFHRFREGQTLFTYLHLAANASVAKMLMERRITAIAYENVVASGRMPLLEPMSEIAGRMSALVGAFYQSSAQGGAGLLAGGVPGVAPTRVVVIGGGISGVNAARMAMGMGADVTIMDINVDKLRAIDQMSGGRIKTIYSSEHNLMEALPSVDILIGAVLVPGARAPRLVTRSLLKLMKPGSVFVDIAIDQGGCAETSKATTHAAPVFVEEGVLHYCVANMPGAYSCTATLALTNATLPYVLKLAESGATQAMQDLPALKAGLNTIDGRLVHPVVAQALPELA